MTNSVLGHSIGRGLDLDKGTSEAASGSLSVDGGYSFDPVLT